VSLAFAPEWPQAWWPVIPLVAGLAVSQVLDVSLKWPNDVVRDDDKIGGILVEASDGLVVAGLGLNLWWPDPPPGVGAVFAADPGRSRGPQIAEAWAIAFLDLMQSPADEWPRDEFRRRCVTIGRTIAWEPNGTGVAVDVDTGGGLIVDHPGGREVLTAGAVRHVRPI